MKKYKYKSSRNKVMIPIAIIILLIIIACAVFFAITKIRQESIDKVDIEENLNAKTNETVQDNNEIQEEQTSYKLTEVTDSELIEINGVIKYKITVTNEAESDLKTFQLLDILPYKGDPRGSNFSGDYTVKNIEIKQTKGNKPLINESISLYVTSSEMVRSDISAKDENLGKANIWFEPILGEDVNKKLTGIAITGTLKAKSTMDIVLTIKTNGNNGNDVYKNFVTAQMEKDEDEIQTVGTKVETIRRMIEGKIWLDSNEDGIISQGENYLENVEVYLINEDGSPAKNVLGEEIPKIQTDANGYYKFENISSGKYKVKIEYGPGEITGKEAENANKTNSKFNDNNETDIFDLSLPNTAEIKKEYINAGIIKRKTKIVAKYIEKDTNKILEAEEIQEGIVNQEYKTTRKGIEGYRAAEPEPQNAEGKMGRDVTYITYYYEKAPAKVVIKYVDEYGNEIAIRDEENKYVGAEYKTMPKEIENYEYERVSGAEEGILGEGGATVVYYYKRKDAKVEIKYIEKDTNRILYEETKTGKAGESYSTFLIEIAGYKKSAESLESHQGIMTEATITEKYYYDKIPENIEETTLENEISDNTEGTNNKEGKIVTIYLNESGNEISTRYIENKHIGDRYITHPKDIDGYECYRITGEVEGTLITENVEVTYHYKKKAAKLVVRYLEEGTNKILASKDVGTGELYGRYRITRKEIENYKSAGDNLENVEGIMNKDVVCVTYYYERIPSNVVVRYLKKENNEVLAGEKKIEGLAGEKYTTESMKIKGYQNTEEPENAKGTFGVNTIYVTYYYENAKRGKVVIKYLDIDTEEEIQPAEEIEDFVGEKYHVQPKEISGFELARYRMPENEEGEYKEENAEVIYYYRRGAERVGISNGDDETGLIEINRIDKTEEDTESNNRRKHMGMDFACCGCMFIRRNYSIHLDAQEKMKMRRTLSQLR